MMKWSRSRSRRMRKKASKNKERERERETESTTTMQNMVLTAVELVPAIPAVRIAITLSPDVNTTSVRTAIFVLAALCYFFHFCKNKGRKSMIISYK